MTSNLENSTDTGVRIAAFLDAYHVMSLATCGPGGPHAANVFYARDGFALLWMSDPESRHSAELEAEPRAAATVAPDYCDFPEIRGVQIAGFARRLVDAADLARARALLEARYPFLQNASEGPKALREAYSKVGFYRLEPKRLTLIDNTRGFGHKDTLQLGRG